MKPEYRQIGPEDIPAVAPLTAAFRTTLLSYKGILASIDLMAARRELAEYLEAGYPVYAAFDGQTPTGYMVLRIEEPNVWVESLFVEEAYRRRGVASGLYRLAEEAASQRGEDTVFNYVHPNNDGMIAFLRSKGYTVLNLIEIRKPYRNEKLTATIRVNDQPFDY